MSLVEKQDIFLLNVANLIIWLHDQGYQVTGGDLYRDPRISYGHPQSCHRKRLAIDLNLFKGGEYLTDTEDHRQAGEYWKKLHPLNRWGGDFGDGNHYSMEHEGVM